VSGRNRQSGAQAVKLTLRQVAVRLGTTRQNVYNLAKRRGLLKRMENPSTATGWVLVIRATDVKKLGEK